MANNIPFSGATNAAGGILLPFEQGEILTQAILRQAGAISLAGDARATGTRKEVFGIWQGAPQAAFVGEGGTKPVDGGEFGAGTLNVKKVACIVTFTDEMLEDVQSGDLNVLVDSDVRGSIADVIDASSIGVDSGVSITTSFDNALADTTQSVTLGTAQDAFATAVSAAMGSLEANGYRDFGVLVPADFPRHLRDARQTGVSGGGTASVTSTALAAGLYTGLGDPLYGLPSATSTNLSTITSGAGTMAVVFARNNVHVRIRKDVTMTPSRDATLGGTSLYQNDLTAIRYVTRLGVFVHDLNRAAVKIKK